MNHLKSDKKEEFCVKLLWNMDLLVFYHAVPTLTSSASTRKLHVLTFIWQYEDVTRYLVSILIGSWKRTSWPQSLNMVYVSLLYWLKNLFLTKPPISTSIKNVHLFKFTKFHSLNKLMKNRFGKPQVKKEKLEWNCNKT